MLADIFRRLVDVLDACGIPYMLTGSFASSYYGAPRGTQDIDVVITATPDQLRALVAQFPRDTYYVDEAAALASFDENGQFNVIDMTSGWKIDFIIRKRRPFSEEEFRRRGPGDVAGVPIAIATPEDVLIARLEGARLEDSRRQIEDAGGILRVRASDLDRIYLEHWIERLGLEAQWEAARKAAELSA
ncbi:MAG TPA: hypothetical protein VF142_04260 [Longimicrobium sp.]